MIQFFFDVAGKKNSKFRIMAPERFQYSPSTFSFPISDEFHNFILRDKEIPNKETNVRFHKFSDTLYCQMFFSPKLDVDVKHTYTNICEIYI
jgi:hypothetical protein